MKSYQAAVEIDASAAEVWKVLMNTARYTEWDSGIIEIEGSPELDSTIKVTSAVAPDRAFVVKVTKLKHESLMQWSGGMPLGLFRGVRTFTLEPIAGARTRFEMREEFTGPLLPLIWKSMPDLQPAFDQFAQGLKAEVMRRVEQG